MSDIGISQEKDGRRLCFGFQMIETGLDRPKLAGPAGWPIGIADQLEPARRAGLGDQPIDDRCGVVAALIIDDDHMEPAWIVLGEKGSDDRSDGFGFVACRDDDGDRRRIVTNGRRFRQTGLSPPKPLPADQQVCPGENGKECEESPDDHGGCLTGFIASGKPSGYRKMQEETSPP